MAGSTTYPTSVDNKTEIVDGTDIIEGDDVNNAYVPVDAIETFIGVNGKGQSWSIDLLEYLSNTQAPIIEYDSATQFTVKAGAIAIKNSGQSNRLLRRNTSDTTVTASDIDTGSIATGTYYYVYAVADSSGTTFTVKFSLSASSPTGLTNYELIGWFYNESAGVMNLANKYLGSVKLNGRDVPNSVTVIGTDDVNTTSATYADMDDMEVRIYLTGRPVQILFQAPLNSSSTSANSNITIDINGTDKVETIVTHDIGSVGKPLPTAIIYSEHLAAGEYTIKIQWKTSTGTLNQEGATEGDRVLIVSEL